MNFLVVVTPPYIYQLQITTDTGNKLKVETIVKEIYKQLLEFITIDVLNIDQQDFSDQDIINPLMNPIINSYFNKHPMAW